jgi:hypothetical protein
MSRRLECTVSSLASPPAFDFFRVEGAASDLDACRAALRGFGGPRRAPRRRGVGSEASEAPESSELTEPSEEATDAPERLEFLEDDLLKSPELSEVPATAERLRRLLLGMNMSLIMANIYAS